MTDPLPNALEQRAASERQRLHHSVSELREHLDVQKTARSYIWRISAVVGLLALAVGYGIAGAFTE